MVAAISVLINLIIIVYVKCIGLNVNDKAWSLTLCFSHVSHEWFNLVHSSTLYHHLSYGLFTNNYQRKCYMTRRWKQLTIQWRHNGYYGVLNHLLCLFVFSTICLGAHQTKHQSSVSLPFVREIHQWPVDYTQIGSVTRKMFPFDDIIIIAYRYLLPLRMDYFNIM